MNADSGVKQGQQFGHLKVIDPGQRLVRANGSRRAALCRCDCGTDTLVSLNHLTSGRVTSCGCLAANRPRIHVEPGTRAGSFTVLGEAIRATRDRRVLLRCDCGTEVVRGLYSLTGGELAEDCRGVAHRPEPEPTRQYTITVKGRRALRRAHRDRGRTEKLQRPADRAGAV